ncbi:hypothetical protein [Enterococcus sp. BWR-S5]|uniref:hypothetical protein n=1 Tax=Enterococcus sp. BWR-S5 TaxID=2787714 RepID=UPI001921919C|nr:hypothetical protein [Enterococcus sp. BWR-S5]MBL1227137.1 hypothetical protein [Enterococcus sp. BWR-S5]
MELKEILSLIDKDRLVQIVDAEDYDLFKGVLSDMSKLLYTCKFEVTKLSTDSNQFIILNIAEGENVTQAS